MTTLNNRLETTIDLAACYSAILEDVALEYPQDLLDWRRDSKRIHQQSKSRGLPFFTVELPALGRVLDIALASGLLDGKGLPHSRGATRHPMIPRLFQGLWMRVFDLDGRLRVDADVTAVKFLRTLLYCAKKLEVEYPASSLFEKTKEFYHAEERLPPSPEFWDLQTQPCRNDLGHLSDLAVPYNGCFGRALSGAGSEDLRLLDSVQLVADRVSGELGQFLAEDVVGRHGPGAVSELPKSKYKYDFGMWSPNLEPFFPFDRFAVANLSLVEDVYAGGDIPLIEEASRLIPVPKDQRGPRLIAAEPLSHQWIQQGLSRLLRARTANTLLRNSIDFFDQRPSQVAAVEASASGLSATVDLKSASDNLSSYVVQRMFRSNLTLLVLMRACRTRFLTNTIDTKEQACIRLRKFATMGSALTFPVQSIVFAMVCLGVGKYLHRSKPLRTLARDVRVFGDDIIVPKDWVPDLRRALALLKLEVNINKTFTEGNFRESCGVDSFRGVNVTPPYIRSPHRVARTSADVASKVDTSNNFFLKGFWRVASWMQRTDPKVCSIPVVHLSAVASGLVTFSKGVIDDYHRLYDRPPLDHLAVAKGPHTKYIPLPPTVIQTGGGRRSVPVRWSIFHQRYEVLVQGLNERPRRELRKSEGPSVLLEWHTSKWRGEVLRTSGSSSDMDEVLCANQVPPSFAFSHLDLLRSRLGRLYGARNGDTGGGRPLMRRAWVPLEFLGAGVTQ